ncbi:MAG: aspartyl/asparaginyl beta-hydroxylase domain-containing protein [Pseudomonadota bacterium]
MNFRIITYIDTLGMMAGLWRRRADMPGTPGVLPLREWRDGAGHDLPVLAAGKDAWHGARNVINRVQRALAADIVAAARIEALQPATVQPWGKDVEAAEFDTFLLPLATNPGCFNYCGSATMHLPVGHLVWLNAAMPHSASNFGLHPRYHLVIEVKKPEVA